MPRRLSGRAREPGVMSRRGADAGRSTHEKAAERSDEELVGGMRRGESEAFVAFVARFHRLLLDYARRAGMRRPLRDDLVEEVLNDLAVQLMDSRVQPRNVRMYVLGAFRNRYLNGRRDQRRRARVVREAALDIAADCSFTDAAEVVVACSQRTLRASAGPDSEELETASVLERLAQALGEGLSTNDRLLLAAASENVPQREVALWLGISHAAARKRLERLRHRLARAAKEHAEAVPESDAKALERFFRRFRVNVLVHRTEADFKGADDVTG